MADKQSSTFDDMYGKLDKKDTPEKVSGRPVARSSRAYLEELKRVQQQD
jgi:hypothetical protein